MAISTLFPPPCDMGLPARFVRWRPQQEQALVNSMSTPARFQGHAMFTGAGKSLTMMGMHVLAGGRGVFLTSTKPLGVQYVSEFGDAGLVEVRGRGNFQCKPTGANCDLGSRWGCPESRGDLCPFWEQYQGALDSQLVVTNYAFWQAASEYMQDGLGSVDALYLDEAHNAAQEVTRAAGVVLTAEELGLAKIHWHGEQWAMEDWARVAGAGVAEVQGLLAPYQGVARTDLSQGAMREVAALENLHKKLVRLSGVGHSGPGAWEWDPEGQGGMRAEPLSAAEYSERYLFRGVRRVVLASACLTEKNLDFLGVPKAERAYWTYPPVFRADRCPIVGVKSAKLSYKASQDTIDRWLAVIKQIVNSRVGRWKGIIHSHSYGRSRVIAEALGHPRWLIMPQGARDTEGAIERYKRAEPPAVLLSPSITTGYDFPGDDCRWQIIAKVPIPQTQSRIEQARMTRDSEWLWHLTAQTLEQSAGRIVRNEQDWGETFVVDDMIRWVNRQYRGLFTANWHRCYQWSEYVPGPLGDYVT